MKEYPDIEYLGEVLEHSWGQRVIRFYDLDGHIIEVGEDMKMVIKRSLASGMNMEEIAVKMDASSGGLNETFESLKCPFSCKVFMGYIIRGRCRQMKQYIAFCVVSI